MANTDEAEVDRIVVSSDGQARSFTVAELIALPLAERSGFILSNSARSCCGSRPIESSQALRWLRNRSCAAG